MNLTRVPVDQAVQLLQIETLREDCGLPGVRFVDKVDGSVNLFRYAAWLADGRPRPGRRKSTLSAAERKARKRAADAQRVNETTRSASEIGEIPFHTINWERRLACKRDQLLFEKTYLPMVCHIEDAPYHRLLAEQIERTIREGGKQAILLPRGGAKTTKCRTGCTSGLLYGRIRWGYNIAANEEEALNSLLTIKSWIKGNPILLEDFPEVCYPISILKSKQPGSVAESQTYRGFQTWVSWGSDEIHLPIIRFPDDVAKWYMSHDPESVRKIVLNPDKPDEFFYVPASAYAILSTCGIDSGIRGANQANPVTMEQIRPGFVILDDIQNDKTAASITSVAKIEKKIAGAIRFLAGPGETISMLMPATVIESGDLADTYGDPEKRPEWRGIRVPMVIKWPDGITNSAISAETPTSKLWLEYETVRRESLRKHGDIRDATEFYRLHRDEMDRGFEVSWPQRYEKAELSAIQYAMDLRFENHLLFLTNMQQVGGDVLEEKFQKLRWQDFASKMADTPIRVMPETAHKLVCQVDVQGEYFAWTVLAASYDFATAQVIDYGTFPEFGVQYFRRTQANSWKLLTKGYLASRGGVEKGTQINADAIYTWGLRKLLDDLTTRTYTRADRFNSVHKIAHIGIDAQDGTVSSSVRNVARMYTPERVIPYHGFGITPGKMSMDHWNMKRDCITEDAKNPAVGTRRWVFRYSEVGRQFELHSDVNAWKDYLFERLRTPKGERGSLELYSAPPHMHELFAQHVCESEYPEPLTSGGVTRNRWVSNPGVDNEFLDCLAACCALASFAGCVYIPPAGTALPAVTGRPAKKSGKVNVRSVKTSGGAARTTFRERLEAAKAKKGGVR